MKKTRQTQDEDLTTDDEAVRVTAMTSGAEKCGRWTMRPTTAREVAWMQRYSGRHKNMGSMWEAGAIAYIHCGKPDEVLGAINDPELFVEAVDNWLVENNPSVKEAIAINNFMARRSNEWASSASDPESPGSPGN
jgi:hypothetical protein